MCTEEKQFDQFRPCAVCEHMDCQLFRSLRELVEAVYKMGNVPYNLWKAVNQAEDVLDKVERE